MNSITQKAGAIILSSTNKLDIALLYRGKENDWSFPKGHIEPKENSRESIVREIKEETGLSVKILRTLPANNYVSPREGLVSVHMFLVQSIDNSKMENEFKNDTLQWIPIKEVAEKLSYDNLKNYFKEVLPLIKK